MQEAPAGGKGQGVAAVPEIMGDATPGVGGRKAAARGTLAWHSPAGAVGLGAPGRLRGVRTEERELPNRREQGRKGAEHITRPRELS